MDSPDIEEGNPRRESQANPLLRPFILLGLKNPAHLPSFLKQPKPTFLKENFALWRLGFRVQVGPPSGFLNTISAHLELCPSYPALILLLAPNSFISSFLTTSAAPLFVALEVSFTNPTTSCRETRPPQFFSQLFPQESRAPSP